MAEVMPGCDAWSAPGGAHGALVVHGFTGNPGSMRGLAEAFAAAGYTVELPRLPGHGTAIEDMLPTGFDDYSSTLESVYEDLASRCDRVVVAGLSMGGSLTAWLATRHPEIAGIICINAAAMPPEPGTIEFLQETLAGGTEVLPGIGSDIADPDSVEQAYDGSPVAPLISLMQALEEFTGKLGDIACPVLIFTSPEDHVVPPANSDYLAEHVSGPVERVTTDRSYHVSTQDYDKALIFERSVEFANRVCS